MRNEEIVRKIKDLEEQLRQLRIELENEDTPRRKDKKKSKEPLKIGEEVHILNPKKGQGNKGIITKVNTLTGYGTVETVNEQNRTEKVVRKIKNLRRK